MNLENLTPSEIKIFKKRKRAVALVLGGQTIYSAGKATGLAPSTVSKLLKRALETSETQPLPALTAALVPYTRIATSKPLPASGSALGFRGQFGRLLQDNPEIEVHIRKSISNADRHAPHQRHLTMAGLHEEILAMLRKKGYGLDDYPFCTASQGLESLRKCYHRCKSEILDSRFNRISRAGPKKDEVNFGFLLPGIVEFDHHKIDVESSDVMPDRARRVMRAIRIPRFWLGLAIEKSSTAILGYAYDYLRNPSQESVLHCLHMIFRGSDALDQGLLRTEEPMIPAVPADFDPRLRIIPREIRVDNAMAHYAHTVSNLIVNRFGAAIVHGLPAHPLARQLVESTFRELEAHIHTLPSTAGTGINDHRREPSKRRKRVPHLTNLTLLRIVHKLIAHHNNLPRDYLQNLSPVEYLKRSIEEGALPVQANKSWFDQSSPFIKTVRCKVHLYNGLTPHVNLLYNRYMGPSLAPSFSGRQIYVKYNLLDIRSADAYELDGTFIGRLHAPRRLLSEPLSERTLKKIKKLGLLDRFSVGDPIAEYTEHLEKGIDNPEAIREYMRIRNIKPLFDSNGTNRNPSEDQKYLADQSEYSISAIEWRPGQCQ
ncbi:hypothetical protein [Wenzhouxiangella limi]|uniref:Integrase catalytic domain-containing protein n=1 Tax=Wenzhouxiangella limi TaxID=2707351 RepID=A0A845V0D5_9GAMM|nr:hypothetical protein [Wenzhouxiangella limi]NDY94756.1 hypothetical protein [Wenzhouxiangella limi]